MSASNVLLPVRQGEVIQSKALVAGEWIEGKSSFLVSDPATGGRVGQVPKLGAAEAEAAVDAAASAFGAWRDLPARSRGEVLRRWTSLVKDEEVSLAELLVSEQGKPLAEARAEVRYAASYLDWYAEEAVRAYGEVIPAEQQGRRLLVSKVPFGACVGITPWNLPAAMVTRKAAPALAAGCTLVLKPAEQTPMTALALCALGVKAGLPPGVLNVVTGDASDAPALGSALVGHPATRKVGFTGSTEVGKQLMAQAACGVKNVALELGGNAPFILFEDGNVADAVSGFMLAKFRNAGQSCIAPNRVLVHESLQEEFLAELVRRVAALIVGNGFDPDSTIGPLIDEAAVLKVERHLEDAVAHGAEVIIGGRRHSLGRTFFEPTILIDVSPSMVLAREETFGPVAAVQTFVDEDDVVARANQTPYGLIAYVYTTDHARIWRMETALETGIMAVNTGIVSSAAAPFGGMKESGIGREGSHHGLDEWLDLKYTCLVVGPEGGST